jgi:hypothetical protein
MNRQRSLWKAALSTWIGPRRKGASVHPEQLAAHLRVSTYGDFHLTDAVRPGIDLRVIPAQGYRRDVYRDASADLTIPLLAASVSRERLFDTFLDLLGELAPTVDVVLETSHHTQGTGHRDLVREGIDLPVLASHLCDFEDMLLNDGCAGIAVVASGTACEVQFDEHKLLIIYSHNLTPFEKVLRRRGVTRADGLKLISESEHYHSTRDYHLLAFEELATRIGTSETASAVGW